MSVGNFKAAAEGVFPHSSSPPILCQRELLLQSLGLQELRNRLRGTAGKRRPKGRYGTSFTLVEFALLGSPQSSSQCYSKPERCGSSFRCSIQPLCRMPGWSGWSCTDDTKAQSEGAQNLATLLLTLSNLMFLPAIVVAVYRYYLVEASIYIYTMFFSTVGFVRSLYYLSVGV